MADALPITRQINEWEGRWPLNTYADTDASKLSGSSQERLRSAVKMTQADYAALIAQRDSARAAFAKAAENYDAFVTLGATGAAPVGFMGGADRDAALIETAIWALTAFERPDLIGASE